MKARLLRLAGIVALLGIPLLAGLPTDRHADPAGAAVDALSATVLHDIGSPLPASATASAGCLIERGSGRLARPTASDAIRAPMLNAGCCSAGGRDFQNSHFFGMTGRLTRGGLHTSALGTPPPHV